MGKDHVGIIEVDYAIAVEVASILRRILADIFDDLGNVIAVHRVVSGEIGQDRKVLKIERPCILIIVIITGR